MGGCEALADEDLLYFLGSLHQTFRPSLVHWADTYTCILHKMSTTAVPNVSKVIHPMQKTHQILNLCSSSAKLAEMSRLDSENKTKKNQQWRTWRQKYQLQCKAIKEISQLTFAQTGGVDNFTLSPLCERTHGNLLVCFKMAKNIRKITQSSTSTALKQQTESINKWVNSS